MGIINKIKISLAEKISPIAREARQGDPLAQSYFGEFYSIHKKDDVQAVYWYSKSADQGCPDGQINLGLCYQRGEGVPQDYDQAMYWFRKAAEQGDTNGQYYLGKIYLDVLKDKEHAIEWFRKAALKKVGYGSYQASFELNKLGINCELDKYRELAEQGDAEGQTRLGEFYLYGAGVEEDHNQAMCWFRKAAEQGCAEAQHFIGYCYHNGYGVPKDETQSVYWYRIAARQGFEKSQYILKQKGCSW